MAFLMRAFSQQSKDTIVHVLEEPDFDPEAALEAAVTPRTVALYVNTPNNPSGRVLTDETVEAMLRVAKRHDLWVFCDEAYEEIYFGERAPNAIWKHPLIRGRAIAFHTLSKSYGFAGARIGFTHGPAELMGKVAGMQTFHTYCAPRPMQFGAIGALREGQPWVQESRRLYRDAGAAAADALGVAHPEGSTFLFVDVSTHLESDAESCAPFLERCADLGVLITPGYVQENGPPLFVAAMSRAGALRAAAYDTHFLPQGVRAEAYDPWVARLRGSGRNPADYRVGIIRSVLVTDDRNTDWPVVRAAERYRMALYQRFFEESGEGFGGRGEPVPQTWVVGNVDACVDQLEAFVREFGITDLVSMAVPPGLKAEQMTDSLQALFTQVAPALKQRLQM